MSDIQDFISHLNKYTNPAMGNRFKVVINTPKALLDADVTRNLSFQCETAELPGRTLATFDARTYGPSKKYPYQTTYEDLNLTFICMGNLPAQNRAAEDDTGLPEKRFFDSWMNLINPINTYNFAYKKDYSTKIFIRQYDVINSNKLESIGIPENAVNYSVEFIEAFPISVNQLPLSWADDSILKLTVTFAYTRWEKVIKTPPENIVFRGGNRVSTDAITTKPVVKSAKFFGENDAGAVTGIAIDRKRRGRGD